MKVQKGDSIKQNLPSILVLLSYKAHEHHISYKTLEVATPFVYLSEVKIVQKVVLVIVNKVQWLYILYTCLL